MKNKLTLSLSIVFLAVATLFYFNFQTIDAKMPKKSSETTVRNYVNVYEYVYGNNDEELNENHYIKIQSTNNKVEGWYYGTSDDFDEGREGYLPGFFVKKMDTLIIKDNSISFVLNVKMDDFFNKPVLTKYFQKEELPINQYKKWDVGKIDIQPKKYKGIFKGNQIIFEINGNKRIFDKNH